MLSAIARVLFGFAFACLTAGITQVLFAVPPAELMGASNEQLWRVVDWMLLSATQSAVFAAPFAMIAAALSEWQGIRSLSYFLLTGVVIAGAAFLALFSGEGQNDATILNSYAVVAYLTTGLAAGFAYWLFGGRYVPSDEMADREGSLSAEPTSEVAPKRPAAAAGRAPSSAGGAGGPAGTVPKIPAARPTVGDPDDSAKPAAGPDAKKV